MEKELCWFGYDNYVRSLGLVLKLDLGMEVIPIRNAPEGLDAIAAKEFPLILFNAPTPVGELGLPENISPHDWVSTDCHTIRCIRETRPNTPLIVTYLTPFPGYNSEAALREYKAAGATDFFNKSKIKSVDEFSKFIQSKLQGQ